MGNFTLPLAKRVKSAVGIEGVLDMVKKAQLNAQFNHIENVEFYQADLDQAFSEQPWAKQHFNKILLDPPRSWCGFCTECAYVSLVQKAFFMYLATLQP